MKTLVIALNAKYIHSALAPWYLKAYCGDDCGTVKVVEFTINDNMDSVLAAIYLEKPDIAAFSCYIWNITYVLELVDNLKKVMPAIKIVLGGPEVSFDTGQLLTENPAVDYIISGEGEHTFRLLLKYLCDGSANREDINGLSFRKKCVVFSNKPGPMIDNLNSIPSPYSDEMTASLGNRTAYIETSRGCPFSCSYCISSTFEGVRYFSLDRVKLDLSRLIKAGVKQVKFVDRTFNCSKDRAKEVFEFIIGNVIIKDGRDINFHFEAAADLFDDEMLDILSGAPAGLIQFEIGIQSTNTRTLEAINRRNDPEKVFDNIRKLRSRGNIHIHLDLIAGLPFEGYDSFKDSFNRVYMLNPHHLQLGFLKMLKGSQIRSEAELHRYEFKRRPPYEALSNKYVAFDEMLELKGIEELVERYCNSGKFVNSLRYIISKYFESPFEFFKEFYIYNSKMGFLKRPLSGRDLYTVITGYFKTITGGNVVEAVKTVNELLKFDFLSSDNSKNLPPGIEKEIYGGFKGMPVKQILKHVHFECFSFDVTRIFEPENFENNKAVHENARTVILFDYSRKNKVTGLYEYRKIKW